MRKLVDLPPFHELNQLDFSDGHDPPWEHGVRFKQLESLAKDIEVFDPGSQESNIDAYLFEVEHCVLDLCFPSSREKLRLIWKTTAKSVHVFLQKLVTVIQLSARLLERSTMCTEMKPLPLLMLWQFCKKRMNLPENISTV
ncbi:hypothetical protein AMECASPLE_036517 [Ameca splendens]|uniref:Uncharacterized protein n=1 Tax=Ameca splendens TaxID=208324 RepID=A0ABV0YJ53_9TELE